MSISDAMLLKRFVSNGDADAFADIVRQYAPLVYGVCLRILEDKERAADAVQETFIQLVRNAANISGSLSSWLHRVATRKAIDFVRADSQQRKHEVRYVENTEKIKSEKDIPSWFEVSAFIDQELDQLDNQMREVIILRYFQGRTISETAQKCGISHQTASRRIKSGVVSLRHKLKSRGVLIPATMLTAMLTENAVKAAPAFVMKELGKIALAGGQAVATATDSGILASIAVKAKIIAIAAVTLIIVGSIALYYSYARSTFPFQGVQNSINDDQIVLRLVDLNSRPVVGARLGTFVQWSDTAQNQPVWSLRDGGRNRVANVQSDKYGKVTLKEGDLFWSVPPTEQMAPITAMDGGHFLAGLQELSREELGKEVTLILQPGCRVHAQVNAVTARKRQLSINNLNVMVYWRTHTPYQYASNQGQIDFVLPPGEYKLRLSTNNPDNSVTLPILILSGQRDLDLTGYLDGTSTLPATETLQQYQEGGIEPNKVVVKLVDPNSQPVVGAWVGTFVDWSDVAESPPIWFLNDRTSYKESEIDAAGKVISNNEGKITLTEKELFLPYWPIEVTVPLTAIDEGHYLAGLRALSREDLGKEVTLSLQPGCRVHGRVTAATARKREWSTQVLTVLVFWHIHKPCEYCSREGRFEFVLPSGEYEVEVYSDDVEKYIVIPISIKLGERDLDLTKYLE